MLSKILGLYYHFRHKKQSCETGRRGVTSILQIKTLRSERWNNLLKVAHLVTDRVRGWQQIGIPCHYRVPCQLTEPACCLGPSWPRLAFPLCHPAEEASSASYRESSLLIFSPTSGLHVASEARRAERSTTLFFLLVPWFLHMWQTRWLHPGPLTPFHQSAGHTSRLESGSWEELGIGSKPSFFLWLLFFSPALRDVLPVFGFLFFFFFLSA